MTNPYEQYKRVQVQTANPIELVVMAYDGASVYLARAKEAMSDGNYQAAGEWIRRVQSIIAELTSSLDPAAGEVSYNLARLYGFINERLGRVTASRDPKFLDEIAKVLDTLKQGWCECAKRSK
ncbi:MAG: flagellar export chaperone FliS [Bacillota bacterium]